MVPFGCFPNRSGDITRMMHAWDLLAKFYEMKVGGMDARGLCATTV